MAPGLTSSASSVITQHLKDVDFPVSREELVAHVRRHASDGVVANLMEMLPKRSYESMGEVMQALVTAPEQAYYNGVHTANGVGAEDEYALAEDEDDEEDEDEEDDEDEDEDDEEVDDEDEDDDEEDGDEDREEDED